MRSMIRRRPSHGTLLGLFGLFVALGGVAYAQGTGTTTTTTPTAAGPPPVAEALHATSADWAQIQKVEYVTNAEEVGNESFGTSSIRISCPSGMKVVGGGLTTTGGGGARDFETKFSGPTSESSWEVRYLADDDDRGETVRGTAICATVAQTRSSGNSGPR